jgi:hypothetical protein
VVEKFQLRAQPWWVNLLWVAPFLVYGVWRHRGPRLAWAQLIVAAIFGAAFGLVEAAVVVYLRAALGLLPGYHGTLADVQRMAANTYQQAQSIAEFPQSLLTVEMLREAATVVMLIAVALLAAAKLRERCAVFLWTFAVWDIAYYAGLWAMVRWPASLKEFDVLFLIPQPWVAQVWFPIAVSGLTLAAVVLTKRSRERT